jgi:hypothetical protein
MIMFLAPTRGVEKEWRESSFMFLARARGRGQVRGKAEGSRRCYAAWAPLDWRAPTESGDAGLSNMMPS